MSTGTATTVAPSAAAASAASAQGQAVAVVDAARVAVAAARAVLLEAIVQGRAPDGVVTLKTRQGDVQIRSTTPLPTGATVALELTRNGEQLSARLLPAAALRPSQSDDASTAPPQAPMTGGNQAATRTASTASSTTATPAIRPESVGGATFGAVALASDPALPTRPVGGSTASSPASAAGASSPPTTSAAGNAGGTTASSIATRSAMAGAPTPSTASATIASPTTTSPTTVAATPGGPTPSASMGPRAATTSVPVQQAATSPAAAAPAPTTPSPTTIAPDAPMATRAAAAALYAQARPTAATRTTPSTASLSAAMPGSRPESDLPSGTRASTGGDAGSTTPRATTRLQPGTTLEVRIAQTSPATASPTGTRPAQPLPATVVGAMPQGRLVVDTPVGRLAVSVPPDLLGTPPGETLSLEWLPETMRKPLSGDGAPQNAQSTRGWPQARDAAAALLAGAEPTAREAADQLVPKPGPRLAQQMMGFIGRGDGDVARWLGEAVMRQLEQLGMTDLVARAEGGATREPDRQPGNGDWRHVTMPLFDGTMLRPIEIRARRRNGGEAEGARDQSRFVVDCVHDELGAVQIDGLMTASNAKKRLDVILRSHVALPEADRVALAALFADTCGAIGLGGDIAFQVLEHFPVVADNPLAHRAVIA